ncbi:hypothetical protein MF672_048820 [Actinomadura sp. ATCC 31491]|uniref:DUF1795 domain-containing protein n=1 Tax=Actinomadura luzonensis TaxID=2805427 RepID=A0ABT0GB83_9ACTN|nr:hypothetical protein [Actinomadura luzonensis]MCK2221658.1 hypothetical protein [Actinomadura luzonensis]
MEGDHRVWPPSPPGARHRRSPPPAQEERASEPADPRRPHPLDLDTEETVDLGEPWNPRIRRTAPREARPRSGRAPYADAVPRRPIPDDDEDEAAPPDPGPPVPGPPDPGPLDRLGQRRGLERDSARSLRRPYDRGLGRDATPPPDADPDAFPAPAPAPGSGAFAGPDAFPGPALDAGSGFFDDEPSSFPVSVSAPSPFPPMPRPASRDGARDALPPSARLYGTPAAPGRRPAAPGGLRRWAIVLAALLAGGGLVAGAAAVALRLTAPDPGPGRLSDALAGVAATLPQGWHVAPMPPVTGFTSVARDDAGSLVMARPVPGPVADARKATAEAAELYSRLLLKGDRVAVVEDRQIPGGHTRALRAEYRDVVNRPAFLRVMLLTRGERAVLLLGLLQPEENARRQALDTVMTSLR